MADIPEAELRELGRELADSVIGVGKVADVDVVTMPDASDSPAHYFSFMLDPDRSGQRPALIQLRLGQRIRDELLARGDDTYPFIRFLRPGDWAKRFHA